MEMQNRTLRPPQLDDRLEAAIAMAVPCQVGADIGADHGKLSASLLMRGLCEHMLVSDISDKALSKARNLLGTLHLNDRADFAAADGLDAMASARHKVDTCFILGMGGETMAHILLDGQHVLGGAKLILSPQTDVPLVREALCRIGYRLRREEIVLSGGRDYILMRAEPAEEGEPEYSEKELLLGPILLRERPAQWQSYLCREEQYIKKAITAMEKASSFKDMERLAQFRETLSLVQEALDFYREE